MYDRQHDRPDNELNSWYLDDTKPGDTILSYVMTFSSKTNMYRGSRGTRPDARFEVIV